MYGWFRWVTTYTCVLCWLQGGRFIDGLGQGMQRGDDEDDSELGEEPQQGFRDQRGPQRSSILQRQAPYGAPNQFQVKRNMVATNLSVFGQKNGCVEVFYFGVYAWFKF